MDELDPHRRHRRASSCLALENADAVRPDQRDGAAPGPQRRVRQDALRGAPQPADALAVLPAGRAARRRADGVLGEVASVDRPTARRSSRPRPWRWAIASGIPSCAGALQRSSPGQARARGRPSTAPRPTRRPIIDGRGVAAGHLTTKPSEETPAPNVSHGGQDRGRQRHAADGSRRSRASGANHPGYFGWTPTIVGSAADAGGPATSVTGATWGRRPALLRPAAPAPAPDRPSGTAGQRRRGGHRASSPALANRSCGLCAIILSRTRTTCGGRSGRCSVIGMCRPLIRLPSRSIGDVARERQLAGHQVIHRAAQADRRRSGRPPRGRTPARATCSRPSPPRCRRPWRTSPRLSASISTPRPRSRILIDPLVRQEDIRRLDVAVDDPLLVGVRQARAPPAPRTRPSPSAGSGPS